MKLPLKRSSQPAATPNWHPNFRNTQLLPDLKVVRTTFFINAACIAIASAALMAAGYREYQAFSIRSSMSQAHKRMEEMKDQNEKFLAANRKFMEGVRKFDEARAFIDSQISGTKLLVALATTLPDLMELNAITYEKRQLLLRGIIKLDSETASQAASAYLDALRAEPSIGKTFTDISLTSLQRDQASQGMSFEILLKQPDVTDGRKPARVKK
jgi:Tfp pilus assembly protein PilE